ncbi:fimbrial protein [Siccibacter colletis]|uniref:Fimbrial protein n=1 Tax=Siccibacter colletis TaxID=1505757 RepID=A0ABY6JDT2_9ENTR|nr:fimbrial protein [Siccibacter colletis]UYU31787.1 fimbrial protein [Siccibacter colletis]
MKRKVASVFVPCFLLIASSLSQATDDVPAILSISGKVENSNEVCTIALSNSFLKLAQKDIAALPAQTMSSDNAKALDSVRVMINRETCSSDGMALSFLGTADDSDRNVFANTQTGSAAAQGVGIALYDFGGEAITPNVSQRRTLTDDYAIHVGMVKVNNKTPMPGLVQTTLTIQLDKI